MSGREEHHCSFFPDCDKGKCEGLISFMSFGLKIHNHCCREKECKGEAS